MGAADYRLWLRLEKRRETDASFLPLVAELKNNHAGSSDTGLHKRVGCFMIKSPWPRSSVTEGSKSLSFNRLLSDLTLEWFKSRQSPFYPAYQNTPVAYCIGIKWNVASIHAIFYIHC